jgi:N-acetylmuramoyl-L-alanine amidase
MTDKDWLIGNLLADGRLETQKGEVQLTTLPKGVPEQSESEVLPVAEENVGKLVLVKGNFADGVLFKAQVVEILPRLTGAVMQMLVEKRIISIAEIQERLSELKDEEEIVEPKKLCALVVGHKKSSPGAGNDRAGINEFEFNEDLAIRIEKKTENSKIQRVYRRTWRELPSDINGLDPHFVISLHCNSYNGQTSGTEVLYYHKSKVGEGIATILQGHLVEFLGLRDRGIKPKTSEDRGGHLLRYTRSPCVIAEPFFIDNDQDLARARKDLEGFAGAYASAIDAMAKVV